MKPQTSAEKNSRSSSLTTDAVAQISVANTSNGASTYAICIDNAGYPASLELHKIYRLLPSPTWESEGYVRVVDESGEDYVYSAHHFLRVKLPQTIRAALSKPKRGSP